MRILTCTLALLSLSALDVRADQSCNLDIRSNYRTLVGAQSAIRQWIEFRRIDSNEAQARAVSKDSAIFSAEFQRIRESNAMEAPNDFTFRSGWILNSQFAFKQGDKLPIKAVYNLPTGERFYALQPAGEPHLTIFAQPDGTLCNKVLNSTRDGDHVFLLKEYKTIPATRVAMATPRVGARAPLTLRIIYLGVSGGVGSFRTLWSQDGRILQNDVVEYDQTATHLQIAGLSIPVESMEPSSVTVGAFPFSDRIAWDAYWTRWFRD